jgi:hypothetical protein
LVVNQPAGKNTLEAYRAAAAKVEKASPGPVAPVGGVLFNGTTSPSAANTTATTHAPWTTYTEAYSTYTTSSADATTPVTVTLVQTVTALPSSAVQTGSTGTSTSATSSTSLATSTGAASVNGAAKWFVAGAAVAVGGLLI